MSDYYGDVFIHEACSEDAEAIVAVIHEAMIRYAENSRIPGTLPSMLETAEDFRKYISDDTVLIAEIGGRIAGTIRIKHVSHYEAEISRFAVLPEHQKSGLGGAVFSAAEERIKKAKHESIYLHTSLDNKSLLNFYISRGFTVESESFSKGYRRGLLRKKP